VSCLLASSSEWFLHIKTLIQKFLLFMLKQWKVNGQSVCRQLATSSENLVASTQFLVALATSESQFRVLVKGFLFTWGKRLQIVAKLNLLLYNVCMMSRSSTYVYCLQRYWNPHFVIFYHLQNKGCLPFCQKIWKFWLQVHNWTYSACNFLKIDYL